MKKNKYFVKKNKCPYCTYPCESAIMSEKNPDKNEEIPSPGDLSFCLMCCNASKWDNNMKLIKFDLESIPDLFDRIKVKDIGMRMEEWWDKNHSTNDRREHYLKIMDKRCK